MADSRGEGSSSTEKDDLKAKVKQYVEQMDKDMEEVENLKKEGGSGRSVKAKMEEMMQSYAEWSLEITKAEHRETVLLALDNQPDLSEILTFFFLRRLLEAFKRYVKERKTPGTANVEEEVEIVQHSMGELLDMISEVAQQVIELKDGKNP